MGDTLRHLVTSGLAVVRDRKACALLDRAGTVRWYGPCDGTGTPALGSLALGERGGSWTIEAEEMTFLSRVYMQRGGVLKTVFSTGAEPFTAIDWISQDPNFSGLCRLFSPCPERLVNTVRVGNNLELGICPFRLIGQTIAHFPDFSLWLRTSHPLQRAGQALKFIVPRAAVGWAVLTTDQDIVPFISESTLTSSISQTIKAWRPGEQETNYEGPFQIEVNRSIDREFGSAEIAPQKLRPGFERAHGSARMTSF